jgi:kynurenine formamidase
MFLQHCKSLTMRHFGLLLILIALVSITPLFSAAISSLDQKRERPLWDLYESSLRRAKYVDLTHAVAPGMPVWSGFGTPDAGRAFDPKTNRMYQYASDGFEANRYMLPTDQLGTQLDPPAHWNPDFPAIDELPPTFAVRPLAVISIAEQVVRDPGYSLQVADIVDWERRHGTIPEGAAVFVRSDWSRDWGKPGLAAESVFPGVSLEALRFLHLERKILLHGHEPLDTDATATFEAERWLLTNGYTQAEGLMNLDQVPEAGALVAIGFAKFQGGLGGYARYIAICPSDWKHGVSVDELPEAPLAKMPKPLRWDAERHMRVR